MRTKKFLNFRGSSLRPLLMVRTLPPPPLRKLVLRQYKDLLCQANQLFDLNARYVLNRMVLIRKELYCQPDSCPIPR